MNIFSRKPICDVFVSYAHKDKDRALALVQLLRARGLTCWFDEDGLHGGIDYEREILDAIRSCAVVMPLLSESALASNFVKYEVGAARGVNKPVVQVWLDVLPLESLKEPFTSREQISDLSGGICEGAQLDRLIGDTQKWTHASAKRKQIKQALAAAVIVLMFFGVRDLMLITSDVKNLLLKEAPPLSAGFSFATRAHASEFPGSLAYQDASARQNSDEPFHPQLAFEVFGLSEGATNWVALEPTNALRSGEHFFIRAETFTPGFLYVFLVDSGGNLQWLFPQNKTFPHSVGTNHVSARTALYLPAGDQRYRLDDTVGEERVFAIYSRTRWEKLERALERAGSPNPAGDKNREIEILLSVTDALTDRAKGIATVEKVSVTKEIRRSSGPGQNALVLDMPARSTRANEHWLLEVRKFRHVPRAAE